MQDWHTTYLDMRELPRELSTFEMQTFFTCECAEREVIDARRSNPRSPQFEAEMGAAIRTAVQQATCERGV